MNNTNEPRSTPGLLLALLVALCMALAACGSSDEATESDSDDASDSSESSVDRQATTRELAGSDAMADDDEDAMADDDEDAMADELALSRAAEGAAPAVDGGFFGDDTAEDQEDPTDGLVVKDYGVRPFVETERDAESTFALDVDTGSYSLARTLLQNGELPPFESVRVEEYVNSFDYDYPAPRDGLGIVADGGPSPFDENNVIVRLGVQAEQVANRDRPDAALTFIVDTSGSMDRVDRLDLVKESLKTLVRELDRGDTVAIVTYSSGADVILPPTNVGDDLIYDAIDSLRPDGSTNLEAGLATGYDLAREAFIEGGINRVILASDGVANVGLTSPDELASQIRDDADAGIRLVTVGVGMGSYNDVVMEQLADRGDGFYAYVNDSREADRVFNDDLLSTLLTVAVDGKIQVEFNPETVQAYRLLGFENRAVLDDDFRNDEVDAGELGAGHQVTAIYELVLVDGVADRDHLGTAQLRWQDPDSGEAIETRLELAANIIEDRWGATSDDFRLAVTVASFAEILRESPYADALTLQQVRAEAQALPQAGAVGELADLIDTADRLR